MTQPDGSSQEQTLLTSEVGPSHGSGDGISLVSPQTGRSAVMSAE